MQAPLVDERARLAARYREMSDLELAELAKEESSLTETARGLLRTEITRRGLALAVLMSPMDRPPDPSLILLRVFRDLPDAFLARSVLDSADIDCALFDENFIRLNWFYSYAVKEVKLVVDSEEAPEALALLDAKPTESFLASTGEYVQPRCPVCRSFAVSFMALISSAAYALAYFTVPVPLRRQAWFCSDCKHQWSDSGTPVPGLRWPLIATLWSLGLFVAMVALAAGFGPLFAWFWCGYVLLSAVCLARFAAHRKFMHAFIVGFVVGCVEWLAICSFCLRHGGQIRNSGTIVILPYGTVFISALQGLVLVVLTWFAALLIPERGDMGRGSTSERAQHE